MRTLDRSELISLASNVSTLERKIGADGPRTPEELHSWILKNFGIDIPQNSVCDDHDAPFDFIKACFFGETNGAVVVANRSGSKTHSVAILHVLFGKFKAGIELCTIGAIEIQAKRAYDHVKKLLQTLDDDSIASSTITETTWKNGSKLEVLPGTMAAVNGPHPQVNHFDEVDLADPKVFDESRNMSNSKKINGKLLKALDIITSTRKKGNGLMQSIVDEIQSAIKDNLTPPYDLFVWCIFETAEKMDNCRQAYPDLPDCDKCSCNTVVKGKWDDGSPRTLESVCKGRFARSEGWIIHDDVVKTFTKVSRDVWEAQQECLKPSKQGLVLDTFDIGKHCIVDYVPSEYDGSFFVGVDFGGSVPHAVIFCQYLTKDVKAKRRDNSIFTIPAGSFVFFDEIYKANIGTAQLATLIRDRETSWRNKIGLGFSVERFADPAGKSARLDLLQAGLKTNWRGGRDVVEQIGLLKSLVDDDRLFVCSDTCPNWVDEADSWHYPEKHKHHVDNPEKPVKDFDHLMDAGRYIIANVAKLYDLTSSSSSLEFSYSPSGSGPSPNLPKSKVHSELRTSKYGVNYW